MSTLGGIGRRRLAWRNWWARHARWRERFSEDWQDAHDVRRWQRERAATRRKWRELPAPFLLNPEERARREFEFSTEVELYDALIDEAHTNRLLRIAERLFLPVPPRGDTKAWRSQPHAWGPSMVLREAAIQALDAEIRRVNKERWDARAGRIVTVATALTGMLGAAAGLVTAFYKVGTPPHP